MGFDQPAPDMEKIQLAWQTWERGEEQPGKTLANMKTAGFADVIKQLIDSGWKPSA
jgi:hypothetical protein